MKGLRTGTVRVQNDFGGVWFVFGALLLARGNTKIDNTKSGRENNARRRLINFPYKGRPPSLLSRSALPSGASIAIIIFASAIHSRSCSLRIYIYTYAYLARTIIIYVISRSCKNNKTKTKRTKKTDRASIIASNIFVRVSGPWGVYGPRAMAYLDLNFGGGGRG